jgi:hypothetical protein
MAIKEHILQTVAAANKWMRGVSYKEWVNAHIPDNYIMREVVPRANKKASMIIRPRQAGKTTLIWKTLASSDQKAILGLNWSLQ